MGAIQSAINQAITVGGLLYTQTGQYKAKQEEIAKQKSIKASEAEVEKNIKPLLELFSQLQTQTVKLLQLKNN